MNDEFYISITGEIFDGYTEFDFNGRTLYLKHLTIKDQRNLHLYYERYKKRAIDRGVETEEDILNRVRKDGLWTDEEDSKMASFVSEIENLRKTKDSMFLGSQKEIVQKTIDEKQYAYFEISQKRKEILGKTAEDYATNMASVEIIRYFVFQEKELINQAFSEGEFDDMGDDEILKLRSIQSKTSEKLGEEAIQNIVLRPFFNLYLSFCENPKDFFGKPLVSLSVPQLKMVVWGKVFHSIFQHVEDIPDDIRQNPDKLLAFSEAKNNKRQGKSFMNENAAASAVFGGTKQDIDDLSGDTSGAVSLTDEIKKAGGKLSMEQMMRLAGQ